jgi:pyruvate dehydrogenase E2 component (dihydrolipoamide acetyltransferase)
VSTTEVRVPNIGDFKDVPVVDVLIKPGDRVKKEDPLITLESEKASMDVPSTLEGEVKDVKVKVGDKVSEGSVILTMETGDAAPGALAAPAAPAAPQPQSQPAAAAACEIRVPNIGDFKDVPVIDVLVKPGDRVKKEDPLITLESEKASMDVPSTLEGVVRDVKVNVGDKVSEGSVILTVETEAATAPRPAAAPVQPAPAPPDGVIHASPAIRKFARELGVDLRGVRGGGPHGRILREDVQRFVKSALQERAAAPAGGLGITGLPAWPKVDFGQYGEIERVPLSRIKKLSGPNLHRNWLQIPHITNYDEADVTELEAFRNEINAELTKSGGARLTMLAFLVKACVAALQRFPEFNSSLDGEELVHKHYYNIGFAADTPNGLVVPVLKNAERKGLLQIAKESAELAAKARDGKLSLAEMQGGTFTISSIGGIGGTQFTQIINAPEVAILGATRTATKPIWNGKEFVPRSILPISVSYDHRVIDGAGAARFLVYLAGLLRDFKRVLL